MSTINSKNVQVGTSSTAAQNFTLYQPATPDGTVRLGVGNSGATTGDVVTVNSAGVTVTGTLAATTLSGALGAATATSLAVSGATTTSTLAVNSNNISAVNSLGFRNRLINSDMRIDQRNAGASVSADNSFPVDRFKVSISGSATATSQRSTVAPSGFTNSLLYTIGTGAAQGAAGVYRLFQVIEGFNTADLAWGTSGAVTVTLSFWVRSSVTGTFAGGLLESNGGTASYVFNYTISAANTWEYKTITIVGSTIGTWQTGNSGSINVVFDLGSGTNFEQAAGSWTSSSNRFRSSGAVVLSATSGATFYITGVQLEAGTVASPFERRDYGRELMMCQRYYYRTTASGTSHSMFGPSWNESSIRATGQVKFPVTMRTRPTALEQSGTAGHYGVLNATSFTVCSSVPAYEIYTNQEVGVVGFVVSSGLTGGQGSAISSASGISAAYLGWSAEL